MSNRLLVALIAILLTQSASAQWTDLNTPPNDWYEGIHFVDTNTGWAVGHDGVIVKSTNGGQSWSSQTSGTGENLKEVYFVNQDTGWAIGDWNNIGNTVLYTSNGGNTWQRIDPDTNTHRYIYDVQFIGSQYGWIVGASGKIWHTRNGGHSWITQTTGNTVPTFESVFFISISTGWITDSDGEIWKTTDTGTNWVLQATPTTLLSDALYDIFFIDQNKGWACGNDGKVLSTSNGGTTWTQIDSNALGNNCDILSIAFVSGTTGFANSCWGAVAKTTDGGHSWTNASAGVGFGEKIFFIDTAMGWAAGSNGISKTSNGGNPIISTGLREQKTREDVLLYPDPVSNTLLIKDKGKQLAYIELYNYEGQKIMTDTVQPDKQIDVSDLPAGVYVARIFNKDGVSSTQKLLISR